MKRYEISPFEFVSDAMYEIFEHLMNDRPEMPVEFAQPKQQYGLIVTPQSMFYEDKDGRMIPVCPWDVMSWERYNDRCAIHRPTPWGWFLKVDDLMYFISMSNMQLQDWAMDAWYRNFQSKRSLV